MIRIAALEPGNAPAWDDFVAGRPDAHFFHQSRLPGLIARVFGHRDRSLVATQDGAVVGILPLVEMRTRLFGHSLVSLPFCVYGGPLAADAPAACALLARAQDLLRQTRAASLELRGLDRLDDAMLPGPGSWPVRDDLYVTFRKPIAASDEANLKAIPRKQRAVVRKGIERGLAPQISRTVDTMHRIYGESVRNLGTPVFPKRWFQALVDGFPETDIVVVQGGGTPVAAVLNLYWRDEVLPYYGGGTAAARACQGNDFLYWAVMRHAAARGARLFDFGRSKQGTGAYAFKKNWGFEPQPLAYRFRLRDGAAIPEHNPLNPKYRLMIAAWKRLPLPVAGAVGPYLVRGLG